MTRVVNHREDVKVYEMKIRVYEFDEIMEICSGII